MTRFEQQTTDNAGEKTNTASLHSSLSTADWENYTGSKTSSSRNNNANELVFDISIYASHGNAALDSVADSLHQDTLALDGSIPGSEERVKDLQKLNQDEQTLNKDVFALKDRSKDFSSFANVMDNYHDEFKAIATDLWENGFKQQASETTAYYPLSHYEHDFTNGGSGTSGSGDSGTIQSPAGSTLISGLDSATNEIANMNPSQIGGAGDATSYSATQNGADGVDFSLTGKGWTDGLWRADAVNSATTQNKDESVQLDNTFSMTESQLANTNEIEKDIVGPWGVAGTQINTKTGEVDFWNAEESKWIDVGSLGPLEADKNYDLQLGVTSNGNPNSGTYTFDYYSLNGQKLDASQSTFNDKDLHWAPGLYIQTQLDLNGNPTGAAGISESNQKLYVS